MLDFSITNIKLRGQRTTSRDACPTGSSGDPVDKTGLADGRNRCLNTVVFRPS